MGWGVGCVAVKLVSWDGMWGGKIYEMGWDGMGCGMCGCKTCELVWDVGR